MEPWNTQNSGNKNFLIVKHYPDYLQSDRFGSNLIGELDWRKDDSPRRTADGSTGELPKE